ncbi:MAG: diguanylate cyclase, partial [Sulfurimonas sp.]|nr:diguanylate cyclase [Sulfurimonas sp.]
YIKHKESYKRLLNAPHKLIVILILLVTIVTTISIYRLYNVGFEEQKKRLTEIVQSEAIMIEIMFNHKINKQYESKEELKKVALKNLMYAHKQFFGFGKTGEYTLGELNKGNIHFLLRHRHNEVDNMNTVSIEESNLAEPMRRALKGQSGAFIGLDYRSATVLAAYTPIKSLGWGLVAKIDLAEVRAPYIKETLYALVGSILIIIIGSIAIIRFIEPLIKEIEFSRQYNRTLFNESPIGLALTDLKGNLLDVNIAYLKLVGYTKDEILNLSYWDITPKRYKSQEEEQLKKLFKDKQYGPFEKEYIQKDGNLVNVKLSGCLIENGGVPYIWSSIEDITENKRNEIALKEAALVFENTHEGIIITDINVNITRVNTQFTHITGYSSDEVIGLNPSLLQSGVHDKGFYKNIWKSIRTKDRWLGELKNRRKNGEYFANMQSFNAINDENDVVSGYVSVFSDISNRKKYEAKLLHLASHDSLTSLPNRVHFNDNLNQAIHTAKRNKSKIGILFLDLNSFKDINDTLGHEVGDHLLKEVAVRLKVCVREADTVARLGGDEFVIILEEIKNSEDAVEVSKKIIQKISEPFKTGKDTLIPSVSIGISIYPDHGENSHILVKCADKAMYVAKQKEQDKYEIFNS